MSDGRRRDMNVMQRIRFEASRLRRALKIPLCWLNERRFRIANPGQDVSETIVVCGVPRGGTTWLAEVLARVPGTLLINEPLERHRALRAGFDFGGRVRIPEDAEWPEVEAHLRRVLSGHYLRPGFFQRGHYPVVAPSRVLVKFCRANRLIPWFVRRYQVRPPVLLVRHPCAVVSSQLRFGAWSVERAPYPIPDGRFPRFFDPYREILASLSLPEERLAARWCLDHIVPLRHPLHDKAWITVAYEALVRDGPRELSRIFSRLGVSEPDGIERYLSVPSASTPRGSPALTSSERLRRWRDLNRRQVSRILAVVDRFGLGHIYGEEDEPDYAELYRMAPAQSGAAPLAEGLAG